MINPVIFLRKKIALQTMQNAVGLGYTHYVAGSTPVEKIAQTVAIFDHEHRAFADKNERLRIKRKNIGQVKAVLWYPEGSDRVQWWLFATPPVQGKNHIHTTENLKDALHPETRLIVGNLELVRMPKKGTSVSKFTWRLTDEAYAETERRIVDSVRSRSFQKMRSVLADLWRYPGFAGIRSQIGFLVGKYKQEVKRSGIKAAPPPPKTLYYIRRLKHEGVTPRQLLKQFKERS